MTPALSQKDHELVSRLFELTKTKAKKRKLVTSSEYAAPNDPSVTVRSWKLNEFSYYDVPSPFPTLARGLFTTWYSENPESKEGDDDGRYRIVARGYDKFFNIGEVPWCKWDSLEKHTRGPYVMTLKSNGCIIFIAALSPTKLLVTSKHSLGPIQGVSLSHAQAGEQWLIKHLNAKGKTVEELAQVLWDNTWTAVAELCDDSFEEHVLPIPVNKTGLHLHGINESCGAFRTLPSDRVAAFAREWGLIETAFHTVKSISEVRQFSDYIAEQGEWNGEPIEGFVVRCHVSDSMVVDARDAPPYPPGSSFFFKVKYDEPYMMYRDWREITKTLLSGSAKVPVMEVSVPKSKLRRQESQLYLDWVRKEIAKDRSAFEGYNKGHGIIATRERFLEWMKTVHGEAAVKELAATAGKANDKKEKPKKEFGKTIIVPVAIPGCGKTTVAVALTHLFGFGHVQSDDIQSNRKRGQAFVKRVMDELKKHDVVIADKNNHLVQHRQSLRDAIKGIHPPIRLLALYWALDQPPAMIHRICSERIVQRGENHQTLRPAADDAAHHENAIWTFIGSTEELGDDEVDEVVEMDVGETMEQSLDRAVDACVRVLGVLRPSREAVGEALARARGYKVNTKVDLQPAKKKKTNVRYFGLLPEVDLEALVGKRVEEGDVHPDMRELWEAMVSGGRVKGVPHVTLVHVRGLPADQELWDRCTSLSNRPSPPAFEFRLGHIVSNGRVMTATVEDLRAATDPGEDTNEEAREFVDLLPEELRSKLHVTVGTRGQDIAPVEAGAVVVAWKRGQAKEDVHAVPLENVVVRGRVKGLMS